MENLIDLPTDIKVGTKILVSDVLEVPAAWLPQYYIGTFKDKVYSVNVEGADCAVGWRRAKIDRDQIPSGGEFTMENKINLPSDIKVGTRVCVRDEEGDPWKSRLYFGRFKDKVFVYDEDDDYMMFGFQEAKLYEVDWSMIPQGTTILVRDNPWEDWEEAKFVCTYKGKVMADPNSSIQPRYKDGIIEIVSFEEAILTDGKEY